MEDSDRRMIWVYPILRATNDRPYNGIVRYPAIQQNTSPTHQTNITQSHSSGDKPRTIWIRPVAHTNIRGDEHNHKQNITRKRDSKGRIPFVCEWFSLGGVG